MKAITKHTYGGPEILQLTEINTPTPAPNQVLVQVKANSANPADWHIMRGAPFFARFSTGLFKPKNPVLGADFSGVVTEVGSKIKHLKPGDKVFGESLHGGAFAEYLVIEETHCAKFSDALEFTTMAAVPIAGLTALQALVNNGKLKAGESVLINGASGGVGHFTVQIAKILGANITAVCSSKNKAFVEELGADTVIPYDQINIHQHPHKYDLVLDIHGNMNHADFKRMGKRGVVVGFTSMGNLIGVLLTNIFSKFPLKSFTAAANIQDLTQLAQWIENGQLKSCIEKIYPFEKTPEAIGYIEQMHTRGKVVMELN